ncbi:Creatinase/aminopeptidase [Marasmius fiardii PR-910]|nr:Creatinase/aminopeptidase [Marasmius fiardii PR-910]
MDTTERLRRLRSLMLRQEVPLDYYVVLTDDAHHTEYVAESDKRRAYISGFTGSAGQAIITQEEAFLLTDSRFWLHAEEELDDNWQLGKVRSPGLPKDWVEWVSRRIQNAKLGIDPLTISVQDASILEANLRKRNSGVFYPPQNLVDMIWEGKPAESKDPVFLHPIEFAGETAQSKMRRLREWIRKQAENIDAFGDCVRGPVGTLISSLPDVAYMLNLRGSDIEFNPLFHAYLFVGVEAAIVFLDSAKVPPEVDGYLRDIGVERREYGELWDFLKHREWREDDGKIIISPQTSVAVARALGRSSYVVLPSQVEIMKAIKNETEIEGLRRAYLRDGICFTQFLSWLQSRVAKGFQLTEWEAARKLDEYRSNASFYRGLASENISASGPNAALPHYEPSKHKARTIDRHTPYLNDSGGQYLDGTCDTTRSVHFGNPTHGQREAYTRVLQGHISIDTATFPEFTTGLQLDALARKALWEDGLNYGHGSGHGFGSFLMTHEGPQGFGIDFPFVPGHVVTNEPGFYKSKEFGVRIESALLVKRVETRKEFGGHIWLGFERLTCVPIHTVMVEGDLLTREEKEWLKEHNDLCLTVLSPYLQDDQEALRWVKREAERAREIAES